MADAPTPKSPASPGGRRRPGPAVGDAGSRSARKTALVILEVLGGQRAPTDAAKALGVSSARYYALETQAVAGLLAACEPKVRGPGMSADKKIRDLEQKVADLERECARRQTLLRVSQRAVGVSAPDSIKKRGKASSTAADGTTKRKRRPKRPSVRALHAATRLRSGEESSEVESG